MAYDPQQLPAEVVDFLRERHLATLTTLRPDGTPHVVAVGFTYDPAAGLVRVITSGSSRKVRNLEAAGGGPAVVCQVDGRRWLALEGTGRVRREPEAVAVAEQRYAGRYRTPRVNPGRVAIEITVERVLGHA